MNWANRITMIRLLLIPVIVILMVFYQFPGSPLFDVWNQTINIGTHYQLPIAYLVAGILFIIAAFTDFLDGYIARKFNQVTTFGKFFDAIADKVLTNTVLIVFACSGIVPIWMAVVLIARDFIIDAVRQILATKEVIMAANWMGKIRAAMEMVGMSLLFFVGFRMFNGSTQGTGNFDEFGWINQVVMIPMYIATVLSVVSAGIYISLNRKQLFDTTVISKKVDEKK
ncbi:CDP-diacylglycerol-glycerol-3-phosphate 3-phosphatidyltransferase [Spiroplasma sabaudiense Ar-1343]|uniref:CDP-diacylglycerol--glycerol-3-phosphate 3-phosphatidyltransferase n=1 Tax=Spiroplasma sabaudiense Ar-1343 TaxID=1276257 RepID=W6AB43_9MOLU|nr:CDP-diacylglycerol--glycerol-3-phosphate 3-phosphatidyltransferase [Spiroplasma sabaudiense]AHI54080.1 CDP-diacylglycerol-glycerol-3-phosphate 3-phosphatidyltransferase [Spiroplasma sabaudiense Ar-1343]